MDIEHNDLSRVEMNDRLSAGIFQYGKGGKLL